MNGTMCFKNLCIVQTITMENNMPFLAYGIMTITTMVMAFLTFIDRHRWTKPIELNNEQPIVKIEGTIVQ
jgi:hypothetical protein